MKTKKLYQAISGDKAGKPPRTERLWEGVIWGDEIGVVDAIGVIQGERISATLIRGHGEDETADGRALGKGDFLMAG